MRVGLVFLSYDFAVLRFAEIPITRPSFWVDEEACTDDLLRHVFRSATDEEMPLLQERFECLREAGIVLCKVCKRCLPAFADGTNGVGLRWELHQLHLQRQLFRRRPCQSSSRELRLLPRRDHFPRTPSPAI